MLDNAFNIPPPPPARTLESSAVMSSTSRPSMTRLWSVLSYPLTSCCDIIWNIIQTFFHISEIEYNFNNALLESIPLVTIIHPEVTL